MRGAISASNTQKVDAIIATEERIALYNELYGMMKIIASAGKLAAEEHTEVIADMYLLYPPKAKKPRESARKAAPKKRAARKK